MDPEKTWFFVIFTDKSQNLRKKGPFQHPRHVIAMLMELRALYPDVAPVVIQTFGGEHVYEHSRADFEHQHRTVKDDRKHETLKSRLEALENKKKQLIADHNAWLLARSAEIWSGK